MRLIPAIAAAILVASPALAEDSPVYGPRQGMFGEGYRDSVEKDGSWRIMAEYHSRDPITALDVALYRAAEMARAAGFRYVQILNGYGSSSYGSASATIYARPTDSPAAPATCRAKRCYTADVAKVLDALSGPYGNQPGVGKPSSVDQYGRQVSILGFGIGAVAWTQRTRD